jgi:hypothetical protein
MQAIGAAPAHPVRLSSCLHCNLLEGVPEQGDGLEECGRGWVFPAPGRFGLAVCELVRSLQQFLDV